MDIKKDWTDSLEDFGEVCFFFFVFFVVLKLRGLINWSWWWVTAPGWIPIVIITLILVLATYFNTADEG